ncbi:vacuolar amino acid transporter 6 [Paracoccidioides lutzii Pb01]|uniref:Vacuolar amino acid transporter 6 n=1 Tax=Paracoccidioides lutzii (strain ATCC MYA-826 / Pb01) TaxID=502779 RepID=C1H045_PARBA|nr:vacuolar amino acid transporter 6 [Paracoccidioides lutzii Pb01]EEH33086.2 vacuolar amino acid transporter 6 [Paracoccidioides lutzii Pb01]
MDTEASPDGVAVGASYSRSRRRGRRHHAGKREVGATGQASWISSVINLLNTIIGAGALAMPNALARMGITLGVLIILWSGIAAGFGLYLQSLCAQYLDRGSASFFALSQLTYPNAAVIFDAAIAIKCFGVGVSYLIIIGDLMPGVVEGFGANYPGMDFLIDRHFWVTAFMLVVIPLSFLRRLDSLKYTSVIALTSIGYLLVLVVAHFIKGDTMHERGAINYFKWQSGVSALSAFPVMVFAYTCHQNMFSILNEISNSSHFGTTVVIFVSIGSAAMTYVLIAITGYLSFGNNVGGNIVGMYLPSLSSTIARAAIVVLVMFSYPLQVHPCRASLDAVLKWCLNPKAPTTPANVSPNRNPLLPRPIRPHDPMGDARFAILTTIILILSFIVAMTVSSLESVLAYVGSTGSTSISFILPGLFYYKISSPESAIHQQLMKEDDEAEDDVSDNGAENEGLLSASGLLLASGILGLNNRQWRKALLRKLSLSLAIYGVVVMIVCLITNTFFLASHQ